MKLRRILATAMALTVVCGAVPTAYHFSPDTVLTASAEDLVYQGLKYRISHGEVCITGYTDDMPAKVAIPTEIDGMPVTSIGRMAFSGCTSLTKITIPSSVTSIGEYAFEKCDSLTEITIPDSVASIGDEAFLKCTSLTEITIPDSVTYIGGAAFYGTPWLAAKREEDPFVVVNGILIDGKACSETVTIPDSVTSIGDYAFYDCITLKEITISEDRKSVV